MQESGRRLPWNVAEAILQEIEKELWTHLLDLGIAMVNQNPEQIVRDKIDEMLKASGWAVQNNKKINFNEGTGQAVREYPTDVGPADYVLFVDKKAVGVIEAKREEVGHKITDV